MRILGIDPGSQRTGVGIIDVDAAGKATHVFHAPLVLLGAQSFPLRLGKLLEGLWALIEEHAPDEVAVEQVFLSNNAMSALKLGQARGAAIAACVVQHMVALMLGLTGKLQADAADALAVAITHAHVRASALRMRVDVRQAWSRK